MRIVLAASAAVTVGLIAFGALGVAGAETPPAPATTTTVTSTVAPSAPLPPRTVAVEGVATEPIDPNANAVTATAVYRQAMADAIADGQAKAQFLAGKAGATVGPVQSIAEGGGYINCAGDVEYQGEQPDFGSAGPSGNVIAGASVPAARPVHAAKPPKPAKPAKHPKARKRHSAKKAAAAACTLSTQVALAYALS
jgi:hypothetical protein